MAALGVPDIEASRRFGRAAVQTMLAISAASPVGAVLESNFYRDHGALGQRQGPCSLARRCSTGVVTPADAPAFAGARLRPEHVTRPESTPANVQEATAGAYGRLRNCRPFRKRLPERQAWMYQ
jgi:hypothetical protein